MRVKATESDTHRRLILVYGQVNFGLARVGQGYNNEFD